MELTDEQLGKVNDAAKHMNLDLYSTEDSALIWGKIEAAEAWVAQYIGKALDDPEAFPDGTPAPVREAVLQLVAHLYENREATLVGVTASLVSPGLFELLAPYREWVF